MGTADKVAGFVVGAGVALTGLMVGLGWAVGLVVAVVWLAKAAEVRSKRKEAERLMEDMS